MPQIDVKQDRFRIIPPSGTSLSQFKIPAGFSSPQFGDLFYHIASGLYFFGQHDWERMTVAILPPSGSG
jgi:hypothetical protein